MRRQYWLNFIEQYTVPVNKWEWDLIPLGQFVEHPELRRIQPELRRIREDRSIGIDFEDKELEDIGNAIGGRLRI